MAESKFVILLKKNKKMLEENVQKKKAYYKYNLSPELIWKF